MKNWIRLQYVLGFGETFHLAELLKRFKTPEGILSAKDKELASFGLTKTQLKRLHSISDKYAEKIIKQCQDNNIWIIPYSSTDFPSKLMNMEAPPVVIYGIGEKPSFDDILTIGVVGTRKISEYGKKAAFSLSARLALTKATIVSGDAIGGDTFAHLGALAVNGKTIAVTGGGFLGGYLKASENLRQRILKHGGTLISEFTPDYVPRYKNSFHIRNRILAALCDSVAVIEAPASSGAVITGNMAMEMGRDIYALPGKPTEPQYEGTNNLINQGASVLISPVQMIENYIYKYNNLDINRIKLINNEKLSELYKIFSEKQENKQKLKVKKKKTLERKVQEKIVEISRKLDKKREEASLSGNSLLVYKAFEKEEMLSDEIIEKTNLSSAEVIKELTLLEIKGIIEALPGSRYKLS